MEPRLPLRARTIRASIALWILMGLSSPPGCGDEVPVARTTAALSAAQTWVFQDGSNGYSGTSDTGLLQDAPNANSGGATTLSADGDEPSGSGRDAAVLLRWDTSAIPAGSVVQSVSLSVRVTDASTNSYPIFALGRRWSEEAATWTSAENNVPWATAGAQGAGDRQSTALGSLTAAATGTATVSWNADGVAKVQQWVDQPAQNYGVVITSSSNSNGLDIATSEHPTVSYRPSLTVTYLPPGTEQPDAAADLAQFPGSAGSGGAASGGAGSGGATSRGATGTGGAATGGNPGTSDTVASAAVLYAVGDVGDCDTTADTETAKLLDGSTDPIALLGDIGYPNGSTADLTNCFGQPWGRHKSRVRPAPGNHEYQTSGASAYFQYFGAAAGTAGKGYYSYDVGGWHVIAINSNCSNVSCSAGGTQEQWLRQDLAAHPAACTIAYWHHPRYNSGHHGSATNMTAIWKALMDFNADIVLTGHEHGYQRWKPMNESGGQVASGITEFVVGTGGTDLVAFSGGKPANVVVRDASTPGILKLTLRAGAYDWRFLPIAGKTFSDQGSSSCH